jgi:hypothetical protein
MLSSQRLRKSTRARKVKSSCTNELQDCYRVHAVHRHRPLNRYSRDPLVPPRRLEARNLSHHELLPDRVLGRCFDHGLGRHWARSKRSWHRIQRLYLVSVPQDTATSRSLTHYSFTFVSLLIYSAVGYSRAKKAAQRGQYAPAHNPAAPAPFGEQPQYLGAAPPYEQNTAYSSPGAAPVELQSHYLPPYQGGAATDYYQQPAKPAHLV